MAENKKNENLQLVDPITIRLRKGQKEFVDRKLANIELNFQQYIRELVKVDMSENIVET